MPDAKMEMIIPQQFIADTIRAEMVRQMPNKERFVEEVVKCAMQRKENSYDRETLYEKALGDMIREEAKAVFKEWLDENRAALRKSLLDHLQQNKATRLKEVVDNLVDQVTHVYTQVTLKIGEER